jgi:prevent-host-death family protein
VFLFRYSFRSRHGGYAARKEIELLRFGFPCVPRVGASTLTQQRLSYKMSYMKKQTVSIRDLQQNLREVIERVERGQVIEITRRRRPVALLAPLKGTGAVSPWPDLEARTRSVFGDRIIAPGGSELVVKERGNW